MIACLPGIIFVVSTIDQSTENHQQDTINDTQMYKFGIIVAEEFMIYDWKD